MSNSSSGVAATRPNHKVSSVVLESLGLMVQSLEGKNEKFKELALFKSRGEKIEGGLFRRVKCF